MRVVGLRVDREQSVEARRRSATRRAAAGDKVGEVLLGEFALALDQPADESGDPSVELGAHVVGAA